MKSINGWQKIGVLVSAGVMMVGCVVCLPRVVFGQSPGQAASEGEEATSVIDGLDSSTIEEAPASREVKARITQVVSDEIIEGKRQLVFRAENAAGGMFLVDTRESYTEGVRFAVGEGDTVMLQVIPNSDGTETAFLSDVYRLPRLLYLMAAFALLIVVVGRRRGVSALVGLGITAGILFVYVFPVILQGGNPLVAVMIGSVLILGVNMHLSHGFSRRTVLAYLATLCGLVAAFVLAYIAVMVAHLSGLSSEDAVFLYWLNESPLDVRGVLLGAVILGATGVLDDIAITQGETVAELSEANPSLTRKELYVRAMRVGRHHIASTVNTLVLAYAGAAMPLLLLFLATKGVTMAQFINNEQVAEEIVRTLAGTSALVLTVPLATWFATFAGKGGEGSHTH